MKLVYSPSADKQKERILRRYSNIGAYINIIERAIVQSPFEAAEEKGIVEGKHITAYRRCVKTGLFSGNFFDAYLYLYYTYVIDESKDRIVIIGCYAASYIS